ncbi:SAS6-like protein [Plasmodium brasilianum]|nr:SAS6-like protein [Plasmodium brasilianum]
MNKMNKNEVNNFLCQFDFSSLEELDPSLAGGYNVCYIKEVPFEIRVEESEGRPREIGSLEIITVKILVLGEELNANRVKIELTSETDLFFHFTQTVDENTFETMQDNQKLMINFSEYLEVLIKMCNSCIREPQSFLAVFTIKKDSVAQLDFIKNMEYKFIELLNCEFTQSSEEIVKQHIAFRYNVIKSKNTIMHRRLQDVNILIKSKNPSLLMQLQKTALRQLDLMKNRKS